MEDLQAACGDVAGNNGEGGSNSTLPQDASVSCGVEPHQLTSVTAEVENELGLSERRAGGVEEEGNNDDRGGAVMEEVSNLGSSDGREREKIDSDGGDDSRNEVVGEEEEAVEEPLLKKQKRVLDLPNSDGFEPEKSVVGIEEEDNNGTTRDFLMEGVSNPGQKTLKIGHDSEEDSRNEVLKEEGEAEEEPDLKKPKQLPDLPRSVEFEQDVTETPPPGAAAETIPEQTGRGKQPSGKTWKKSKKSKDVWTTTTRKGKKKLKNFTKANQTSQNPSIDDAAAEEKLFITPIPRFPDRSDDGPEMKISLSKVYKAEKVELSDDRLSASSTKGYRMVRATRGVSEGAWYFEITVTHLGESGHTRLGWSTEKADLQAPVGYDENSYGYRDVDGSKVHKALREKYGAEGYKEGDVLGFYINLPDGESYAPAPRRLVWHKGQRYVCATEDKEDAPKKVPGSEISYFKNGLFQGAAFTEIYGGRYYPAASMYTLPNQPACVVKFNFGPDFDSFPEDFCGSPAPRPMSEVPYQSYDDRVVENGNSWNSSKMCHMVNEGNTEIVKAG